MIQLKPLKKINSVKTLLWDNKSTIGNINGKVLNRILFESKNVIENNPHDTVNVYMGIINEVEECLGIVGLRNIECDSAELVLAISKDDIENNFAICAMRKMIGIGFERYGLASVFWKVAYDNDQELHFYDRNGFIRTEYEGNNICYRVNKCKSDNDQYNGIRYVSEKKDKGSDLDASIIILSYNPELEAALFTIESSIRQMNLKYEIIISDDGSDNNLFEYYNEFFSKYEFAEYKLLYHSKNQGTVRNCYDALKEAKGKVVKLISPGDAFCHKNSFFCWINNMKKNNKLWSIGKTIYYCYDNKDCVKILQLPTHPQQIDCYLNNQDEVSLWNYVALDDYPLGAAIICTRELLIKYLKRIINIVIYAEDNIFRWIMYDGNMADYYDADVIFYEYGNGISTCKSTEWNERILSDKKTVDMMMISENKNKGKIHKKIDRIIKRKYHKVKPIRWVLKTIEPGRIKKAVKFRLCPRISEKDIDFEEEWWIRLCKR